jgi:hypothetical protein
LSNGTEYIETFGTVEGKPDDSQSGLFLCQPSNYYIGEATDTRSIASLMDNGNPVRSEHARELQTTTRYYVRLAQ